MAKVERLKPGDTEGAAEQADVRRREAEVLGQLRGRRRQRDTIDVVHENSRAKQTADEPSSARHCLICLGHR